MNQYEDRVKDRSSEDVINELVDMIGWFALFILLPFAGLKFYIWALYNDRLIWEFIRNIF